MTVLELAQHLHVYIDKGYGECELETIDQGGNAGEVLRVYNYSDTNSVEGSVVVIEVT